jgi:histidinol-phosphatase
VAPLRVLVSEAGGRFSDLSGQPGIDGGSALSTNGLLHEPALTLLAGTDEAPNAASTSDA